MQADEMPAHFEREDGDGERQRDPEAPGHVDELGARAGRPPRAISGSSAMPQIGQAPGMVLPNFWMHRAGVDRARGRGLRGRRADVHGVAMWQRRWRVSMASQEPLGSATNFSRQPAEQK